MVRYYFDIRDGDEWQRDDFGIELADLAEARAQAISILPDIAQDAGWSDDHHELVCRVRIDDDSVVYEGELTFSGRTIKPEPR